MEMSYSPHRQAGGTLHLPSPTHAHGYHLDGFNSINNLRRSLSRSPSKPQRFQLYTTSHTPSGSPKSPLSPPGLAQRLTPSRAKNTENQSIPVSPLESQSQATAKKSKFPVRKSISFRSSVRNKSTPNSPMRRVLSESSSQGNAMPSRSGNELSEDSFGGTENGRTVEARPHGVRLELNDGPIRFEFAKSLQENTAPVKSSPLKRSDGLMNLDVGSRGSPVAKRRSLHGAQDFEMLKHALGGDGACDDRENDHETEPSSFSPSPHRNSSLRKSLSLRKSTLQQRHTPSQPKHQHHEFAVPSVAASASKSRQRFSLDGALSLDTQSFNSPFRRSLPPQSGPLFPQYKGIPHRPSPASKQPHPLANALTPSSSTSSLSDDNQSRNSFPQDAQSPAPQQTRPHLGFSKSLPLGATRPPLFRGGGGSIFSRKVEDGGPAFSTPEAYKMARPLPAAFLSTGLISKKNRNAELSDNGPSISYAMPDTPSKRVSFPPMTTTPFRRSTVADTTSVHHEFGSPSPFSTHARKFSTESFGKGVSTFGTRMNSASLNRKASFTSIDGDDQAQSPTQAIESQSSNDEFPPTPTKASDGRRSKENSLRSSLFGRRTSVNADTFVPPSAVDVPNAQARKSESPVLSISPADYEDVMAWNYEPPSPSITILQNHRSAPMSFAQSRLLRQSRRAVSVPLPSLSIKISPPTPSPLHFTKISYLSAATPTDDKNGSRQTSPHTPQDSFYPPDPSGLSISGKSHAPNPFKLSTSSNTSFPPATPTGHRDNLFPFGNTQNAAVTCVLNNDVDTSLTARFGTVVVYGVGEFSQVYRVENPLASAVEGPARSFSYFGRVWAVKKTKRPFTGLKDKEQKIREVKILKALRGHDHVIQFTDAWEAKGHLYIQTEFCENGNLKDFLTQTGFKARLDDFRIWKILLELSLVSVHVFRTAYLY